MKRLMISTTALFWVFCDLLAAQEGASAAGDASLSTSGGSGWVVAVNLVIWTGIFLYLLSLHGKIRSLEKKQ